MANKQLWQDDYWLLMMQAYLQKPVGIKPTYCREMVNLSLELHIAPQTLFTKMCAIANLETPRIERIWETYGSNPRKLARAAQLLRSMRGFGEADAFYDGVEMNQTFESDWLPLDEDSRFTPVMLVIILDLYFHLTPVTMVAETPEVVETARLLKLKADEVAQVLEVFQQCDPYLNRRDTLSFAPMMLPCQNIWRRYGNSDLTRLSSYASQLKEYYR